MRKKSENSRFEISYSVLAPFGGIEKNLNISAQLHYHPLYEKTPKHFLVLHGLIDFRCAQTFGTTGPTCSVAQQVLTLSLRYGLKARQTEVSLQIWKPTFTAVFIGPSGDTGATGATGFTGQIGTTGARGNIGPTGQPGADNVNGSPGVRGICTDGTCSVFLMPMTHVPETGTENQYQKTGDTSFSYQMKLEAKFLD